MNEAEAVIGALTNSEAYEKYISADNAMKKSCVSYSNSEIRLIGMGIDTSTYGGYKKLNYTIWYESDYVVGQDNYVTINEVNYIVNYFKNKGYHISYKLGYHYWWERLLRMKYTQVEFSIDWDFSKAKGE